MEEGIIVRYDGTKEQFLLEDISQYNGRLVIISGDVDGVAEGFYVDGVDEDGNVSGKYFDLSGEHVKIALIGNSANDSMLPKTITGALAYTDALKGLSNDDYQKVTVYGVKHYALVAAQTAKREAIEHVEKQGFAKDLTGVVEPTAEEFTFRPSAGDKSIRDESAVIRRIKGNTSVWNQLHVNRWWGVSGGTKTENSDGSVTFTANSTAVAYIDERFEFTIGHKYLMSVEAKLGGDGVDALIEIYGYSPKLTYQINSTKYTTYSSIVEAIDGAFHLMRVQISANQQLASVTVKNGQVFDLTALYDAGNEPATVEEFKALYPDSYYPYSGPTVRAMTATGIETIGANAFNKDDVVGGKLNADGSVTTNDKYSVAKIEVVPYEKYTLTNVANAYNSDFTYALYDSNDTFLSIGQLTYSSATVVTRTGDVTMPLSARYMRVVVHNDYLNRCCVNLKHSGTLTAEEAVYFKNVRMLPEIAKYFPNGMHGIGDVYDEINEEYAIQRLGVRTYEDGDSDNTNVKTDGSTTVYILAEPIVTPITEPLQLDYKVADFGTEKMLSDTPSSPFRAETVYQFNAEGRIRDNSRNIERIESLLNAKGDVLDYIYVADFSVFDLVMGSISKSLIDANVQALVSAINEDKIIIIPNGSGGICVANTEFDSEDMYMRITPPTGYSRIDVKIVIGDMAIDGNNVTLTKVETLPMVTSLSTAASSESIDPNTVYVYPATQKLGKTFVLQTDSMSPDAENIWRIRFGVDMYSTGTYEVSVPSRYGLVWQNGKAPTFVNGYWYELSFRLIGSVFLGECKEF